MQTAADVSEDDCTLFWGSYWTVSPWRWRHLNLRNVNNSSQFDKPITSQRTWVLDNTAVRTQNLTIWQLLSCQKRGTACRTGSKCSLNLQTFLGASSNGTLNYWPPLLDCEWRNASVQLAGHQTSRGSVLQGLLMYTTAILTIYWCD
jgi:hypothetical protein